MNVHVTNAKNGSLVSLKQNIRPECKLYCTQSGYFLCKFYKLGVDYL